MRDALAGLNVTLEREQKIRLTTRTGVNTGEVVAGDAATGQQLVTGDAVNVASRLEQAAGPGEILLGETTYRLVQENVRAEHVEPLELKGKSCPLAAWKLLESCRTFPLSRGRLRRRSSGARKSLRHSEQRSIRLRERKHA